MKVAISKIGFIGRLADHVGDVVERELLRLSGLADRAASPSHQAGYVRSSDNRWCDCGTGIVDDVVARVRKRRLRRFRCKSEPKPLVDVFGIANARLSEARRADQRLPIDRRSTEFVTRGQTLTIEREQAPGLSGKQMVSGIEPIDRCITLAQARQITVAGICRIRACTSHVKFQKSG